MIVPQTDTENDLANDREAGRVAAALLDVSGAVRRLRRACDLSQRELAAAVGLDQAQIARIEGSRRDIPVSQLNRILAVGGLRLAIVDDSGLEVAPMPADVLRDNVGKRMPAHLDVREASDRTHEALRGPRYDRQPPRAWYHRREERDRRRRALGVGRETDQPTQSEIAQRALEQRADQNERRRPIAARALLGSECWCPQECWERATCAPQCACRCEVK